MAATNRRLTVVALLASMFMAAMEMTVVSTAMPTVAGDLGGIHLYAWVFSAYLLASTVMVPLFGKLADIYGRKPVFLAGVTLFLAGSAASGAAASMPALIAFRSVQGLGAGAMQPIALTIIGDLFTVAERARVQGLFGAVWGLAGLVGPVLGGLIVRWLSWRWVFFVNIPFGLAAALILLLAYHEQVSPRAHPLDVAGALLLAAGIVALLAATHGGEAAWALVPAAVLLGLFLRVEARAAEPVLPLELFRRRTMAVASALGALVGAAMLATVSYIPLFVQGVLGGSPTAAGSAITPMVIGWPIASALAGRLLPRLGFRALVRYGLGLSAAAAVLLALLLKPGASLLVPRATTLLFGFGLGLANTALLIAVQTSVDWRQRGVATASTMFFRSIGGTLAVGALGGLLAGRLAGDPAIPPGAADALLGPAHGASLAPEVLARLGLALASGLQAVFWVIAGLAAAAALLTLAFPEVPLQAPARERAAGEGMAVEMAPAEVDCVAGE